ncbi:MAG: hybrid sensor histidine kinase/response regulator [Roseateles sp.]|uniref:hybrid sensor histidine kinase/response regulator n=1 Tax=Roseateles sp. TaxID=1971397 RepID=UPI004036E5A9
MTNQETSDAADQLHQSDERFRLLVASVRDYAIFMLDPKGYVLTWNAGARRLKGYLPDEIIGRHFSTFYPEEALARDLPQHELEVASSSGSFEDEGWRLRKDGSRFWANVVITAMREPDGRLVGFAKVTRDLTQRRAHEEELRRSEERFRLLVEGVADYAIFMLDPNGNIATWNVGAERIKGYTADDIIGQHFSRFYPAQARESGWPEHELLEATAKGSFVDEGWRIRKDGSQFWANVTITALRDDTGRLLGFAKLTRDLTEKKRVEAAEQQSRQRDEILQAERSARMAAQHAVRIKDEFLATLSHELRTPLSAILGWSQILLHKGASLPAQQLQRAHEVIDRNARAQAQLIDDLLDLSRIVSGKTRLEIQQVQVAPIVQAAIDSARPSAEAKGLRLQALLEPVESLVSADPARFQQVVWNLLTNAIKFTPKGGQIQVLLQRVNSHIELSVSDTGIGIPPSFLPHVFERFTQHDGTAARNFGGLGLGLAICKQLVELHGGSIRAASQGENLGATFSVTLPNLEGVHAFLIDDESDVRELMCRVFENQGVRVTAFSCAEDALTALQSTKPTVIVSDIGMPKMDGYQFMRAVRAAEQGNRRIPALALTAFARAEDRKRSLLAGYQAHLAKPFDLAELVLVVADLVSAARGA